ncbi:MAG: hybrid sensor histidine kinase/response regulator transcription factor, partial [Ktedonobacteraceae bacterium]|nr:hybrid sensor histidine kinase/response regulator transcription factor [Ktedonobacteraceae bacterium]
ETNAIRARRLLLDHVRRSSRAQLVVLFVFDSQRDMLIRLAQSGRRSERVMCQHIPAGGLFAGALAEQQPLHISWRDPGVLPEERKWLWPGGYARLYTLRASSRPGEHSGILLLSYRMEEEGVPRVKKVNESEVLICSTLLTSYLTRSPANLFVLHGGLRLPATADGQHHTGRGEMGRDLAALERALLERERKRIARDLHDGVAQRLAHALQRLEMVERLLERQQVKEAGVEVSQARLHLADSLHELRHCINSPQPLQLAEQSLAAALRALLDEQRQAHPATIIFSDIDETLPVPLILETPIFRFIQEALTNVNRHALATQVHVRLCASGGLLVVEVSDNGISFAGAAEVREGHNGLRGMRERVQEAGGIWELQNRPGQGTCVKVCFPLQVYPAVLTERERDVLRLLAEGLTNRKIAERLSISCDTVKSHVHHIMRKMCVHDRTQAAVQATRQGLL